MPGDVLLYAAINPDMVGRTIAGVQRRAGFDDRDAQWTHAAVYLFDDIVVEAVPGRGVVTRTIYEDVPHRLVRLRRPPQLDEAERYRIALRALRMLGAGYSHGGIVAMAVGMWRGLWNRPMSLTDDRLVICSKVFHDAYIEERLAPLAGCQVGTPATPAHLSATPDLLDVKLGWLKLAP